MCCLFDRNYELSATFREFVLYLIDPNNTVFLNDVIDHGSAFLKWTSVRHWMPFYELSYPCHVDYDVIAHMETIDDDARLVNAFQKTRIVYFINFS